MLGLLSTVITPTTVLVFVIFLLLTYYVIHMPRSLNMPPGPFPLPVIGSFLALIKKPEQGDAMIFTSLARKYGKIFSLKLGSVYVVVIADYSLLQEAYVKKSDAFSNRPQNSMIKYINETIGAGIVTNNGPVWKEVRRTALMTMRDFGVGKESLEVKIKEEVGVILDRFDQHKGQPFSCKFLFNMATSNVICGIIFGSRFDYEDAKFKELLRVLELSINNNPNFMPVNFFPYLKVIPFFRQMMEKFNRTFRETTDYVQGLIKSNESTYDPDNIRHFIDLFLKMKQQHRDDKAYDERCMPRVITDLFTAGSDTTANTLTWAMFYMAANPDVQTRCQQEIDDVLGKGKMISLADKDRLPYVQATIFEVLRIRPATPTAPPHVASRDVELLGYAIPKDTVVLANLLDINRDPQTFPNPDKFDPGHFLSDDGKLINRERLVTFSMGPRSCLGEILAKMELTLFFTSVLQFYTISPEPGKSVDLTPVFTLVLRQKPQNLVFTRRE